MRLTGTSVSPTGDPLESLFEPLNAASGIVLAVSGGPDSIALMHLVARWGEEGARPPVLVATVDHSLRPEAAEEARLVADAASALGFRHRTLVWAGAKPRTALQEAARNARYDLLLACAREAGASHLVTAHTLDDQAETVLMRLSRGSGLAGLAGMRTATDRDGTTHLRPLLGFPKAALVDLCQANGWPFVQDPSNADDRFARSRWRKLMPTLAAEGLTPERLGRLAVRAARVEDALDLKAREALARAALGDRSSGRFRAEKLLDEPFEIASRALALALASRDGGAEPGRLDRLEACTARLCAAFRGGRPLRFTLRGAVLSLDRRGELTVAPEPVRRRGTARGARGAAASPHSLGKGGGHP